MSVKPFDLQPGERIVLKTDRVRRERWGMHTGELVLTDRALVYVDRGLLGGRRGYVRFGLDEVGQVLVGEAPDGSAQLEVYHVEGEDEFGFSSGGKRLTKTWKKAVDKRLARLTSPGGDVMVDVGRTVGRAVASFVEGFGIGRDGRHMGDAGK